MVVCLVTNYQKGAIYEAEIWSRSISLLCKDMYGWLIFDWAIHRGRVVPYVVETGKRVLAEPGAV